MSGPSVELGDGHVKILRLVNRGRLFGIFTATGGWVFRWYTPDQERWTAASHHEQSVVRELHERHMLTLPPPGGGGYQMITLTSWGRNALVDNGYTPLSAPADRPDDAMLDALRNAIRWTEQATGELGNRSAAFTLTDAEQHASTALMVARVALDEARKALEAPC
jgi:hypothetical protein